MDEQKDERQLQQQDLDATWQVPPDDLDATWPLGDQNQPEDDQA